MKQIYFLQKFITKLIILISLLSSQKAFAINMFEAIELAKDNNRNIKLEKIRTKVTEVGKSEAIAEFLPKITASATYGQRYSYYSGQTNDSSLRQSTRQLNVEQPIFDGFHSVSKYKEAKYKIKSAHLKTSDKILEISFEAVQAYSNLFRYEKILSLQKQNQQLAEKFLKLAQRRKDIRIIDNNDIIKFEFETSIAKEKYLDSLAKFNKAKIDYLNVVGEIHNSLKEPRIIDKEFDVEEIIQNVLQGNKKIESSRYEYLASKFAHSAEKSNLSPKLFLTASVERQESVIFLNNRDLNNRSLFLNLTVPIFNKGIEYSNIAKARYEKEANLEEYEITKDQMIQEAKQSFEEYRFYQEINKSNLNLFELSKKRFAIFQKRQSTRVEDPIEVIRVNIEKNEREINYINSRIDMVIAHYKIKYLLGEI